MISKYWTAYTGCLKHASPRAFFHITLVYDWVMESLSSMPAMPAKLFCTQPGCKMSLCTLPAFARVSRHSMQQFSYSQNYPSLPCHQMMGYRQRKGERHCEHLLKKAL